MAHDFVAESQAFGVRILVVAICDQNEVSSFRERYRAWTDDGTYFYHQPSFSDLDASDFVEWIRNTICNTKKLCTLIKFKFFFETIKKENRPGANFASFLIIVFFVYQVKH
jgi:hypothetical protein